MLVVELLAVVLFVTDVVRGAGRLTGHGATVLAALAVAGVLHTEIALRVERMRRRVTPSPHVDLSSVWTFAAALLLPPLLATLTVIVIYLHLYLRVWRPTRNPAYRWLFTTATVVLAVHAAAGAVAYVDNSDVFGSGSGLAAIVTALLCYTAVNTCLVVGAVVLSAPERTFRQLLGHGDEVVLELATLSMGALAAGAISSTSPLHALLVLPPLVVLHRAVLVRHFQEVASIDGKTGLLNAAAWQDRAHRVLQRAQRNQGGAAVLILDLDHFKLVNDRHGHLAGDRVLMSVAEALRAEVRDNDLVGRFGGEEFVIMLPGHDGAGYDRVELEAVADRIRRRVDALGVEVATADGALTVGDLSVSVGGASFPDDAADLDGLLEVADSALYAAKRSGRNAVRMGLHVHATQQLPQRWADGDGSCASPAKRPLGESAEPAPRPSPRH
ncbi:GGDEF domain-containing protein [Pseudonocardia charpentierae]|uniref:GGDEF domain-containing protein n=1 Tax=Pseudonocardia charpentierae TaxID=3075545 RepID=A0ABU2N6V0_9PSEU|nr:GGDEF domain-containing protein [Pseudonocardia sp. DSM 45834]MDT0349667.1 GGDEF domain-containing protein [Pseudonocardia sp. DSM 45834]